MIKKVFALLVLLFCTFSYAQDNFSLYYFYRVDEGKGYYIQIENFLKNDSIYGIYKTYHIADMVLNDDKVYFKNQVDTQSKKTVVNLVKAGIKNKTINLFDSKSPDFLAWFEKEKKGYKDYYTFKLNGREYYSFNMIVNDRTNTGSEGLIELRVALTKWSAPKFYERYQQNKKEEKEEAEKAKSIAEKRAKMVVSTNPKNFKRIFISQLSKLQNNKEIETKITINNKGVRTKETISGNETKTKTDVISNLDVFKNNLNELVLKEKLQLQWPPSFRPISDVGKTDGYIEIEMVENAHDYQDDKVEYVFSWMINSINKENKKADYRTEISESSIKFLESILNK